MRPAQRTGRYLRSGAIWVGATGGERFFCCGIVCHRSEDKTSIDRIVQEIASFVLPPSYRYLIRYWVKDFYLYQEHWHGTRFLYFPWSIRLASQSFCLGTMTFGEDWGWGSSPAESEAILSEYVVGYGFD